MFVSNPSVWAEQMLLKLKQKMPYAIEKAKGLSFIPCTAKKCQWKNGPYGWHMLVDQWLLACSDAADA